MRTALALLLTSVAAMGGEAPPLRVTVRLDRPLGPVSPLLTGCSLPAAGSPGARALLPELVANRSFEALGRRTALAVPKDWGSPEAWEVWDCGGRRLVLCRALGPQGALTLVRRAPWEDYHLTVLARKLDGPGGLRVLVEVGGEHDHIRWTLGDLGNRMHTLERVIADGEERLGPAVAGRIEPGRAYRIEVQVAGRRLRCFLDGRLIHVAERGDTRWGGVGLGAANATAEYFRLVVHTPRRRPLYGLDPPAYGKRSTLAARWETVADPRNDLACHWDMLYPANSYFSQGIVVSKHAAGDAGIRQRGIPLARRARYRLRLFLRAGRPVDVTVALRSRRGRIHWRDTCREVPRVWRPYRFEFAAPAADPDAELCILLDGAGEVHVDQVSLVREDQVSPFALRQDVVEWLRKLRPTVLRWPAGPGAAHTNWERSLGPPDERPVVSVTDGAANEFHTAPADFGTDEFLALCRELGAEPLLGVNPTLGMRPALYWLEYCNGAANTPRGSRRAEHGHPAPYGVRYWAIGSEPGQGASTPQAAHRARAIAQAMREEERSVRILAPAAALEGEELEATAVAYAALNAAPPRGPDLAELARRLQGVRKSRLLAAVLDWDARGKDAALTAARTLNLLAREAGPFAVATWAGPWARPPEPAGEVRALPVREDGGRVAAVLRLFRAHALEERLAAEVAGEEAASASVDLVAGRAGPRIVLRLVHTGRRPRAVQVVLAGASRQVLGERARVLRLEEAEDAGAAPARAEAPVKDDRVHLTLSPRSVTVLVVDLKEKRDDLLNRS